MGDTLLFIIAFQFDLQCPLWGGAAYIAWRLSYDKTKNAQFEAANFG